MVTFGLYRFSPDYLREAVHSRLAWSVKSLLDAWPREEWNDYVDQDGRRLFDRLKSGCVDGCDIAVHHCLLCCLLADQFVEARYALSEASRRSPRLHSEMLAYGPEALKEDAKWYERVFEWNDLDQKRLLLCSPHSSDVERCMCWMKQVIDLLQQCSPKAYAEFRSFRPLWLMITFENQDAENFMGYSSSLAWGTIGLNVNFERWSELLVQVIHELAHQLLFALALEVPLAWNDPMERYQSPLRLDQRPMDGVLHACFVSARTYQVLNQIQSSSTFSLLDSVDQALIKRQSQFSADAVLAALRTIDQYAHLSALGERMVTASRQALLPR